MMILMLAYVVVDVVVICPWIIYVLVFSFHVMQQHLSVYEETVPLFHHSVDSTTPGKRR